MRTVKKHAKEPWMVLYIERWLKAPVQEEDGQLVEREKGTPQGGVISPVLANLFLHYALDRWMAKQYRQMPFERYADDADDDRRGTYWNEKFDFLGYTFRPRRSKNRQGKCFINFSPAVSDQAVKAIRAEIRSWELHLRSDKQIEDLSRMFNPKIRGWFQYYGRI